MDSSFGSEVTLHRNRGGHVSELTHSKIWLWLLGNICWFITSYSRLDCKEPACHGHTGSWRLFDHG